MRILKIKGGLGFALCLVTGACATQPPLAAGWSSEKEKIYQQCLEDSMAMAVAWEMIEQSCREQAETGADGELK